MTARFSGEPAALVPQRLRCVERFRVRSRRIDLGQYSHIGVNGVKAPADVASGQRPALRAVRQPGEHHKPQHQQCDCEAQRARLPHAPRTVSSTIGRHNRSAA